MLLTSLAAVELDDLTVKYKEAFEGELVPQAFGFLDVMWMLKGLYEVVDMRPSVAREQKTVTAKSSRGE